MEPDNASSEKVSLPNEPIPLDDLEIAGTRTVAFNHGRGEIHEEKLHHGHVRPRGVEIKREMTKEDKELAAAGYEHLEEQKTKAKAGTSEFDNVDLTEHRLGFSELPKVLETQIDTKDPGASFGLTSEEAKERLVRDGPNVLTPPKKKSALRKVHIQK
jgi:sodium/potassium-transporting ATPase subunit alpha